MMMKEPTPRTPASSKSIVRNHSPYCESTGPIVQEGFVAARIRALQGFSDQAHISNRSHSPLTPCPPRRLHVYRLRSPPRHSLAPKPVLAGTVKRFNNQILSKGHRNFASASGGSTMFSDIAPSLQPQEQQSSLAPITLSRLYTRGRTAENPPPSILIPSSYAQGSQDHIIAPSMPYGSLSEVDQFSNVPVKGSPPPEKGILSPRAIQADLVEPRATWDCLPQNEYRNSHEQALKPRGSIAEKLGSMVEQGWVEGDTFGRINNSKLDVHSTESRFHTRDTRLNSRSESLSKTSPLQTLSSNREYLPPTMTEARSESQHSTGEDTSPHMKQDEPRKFAYHVSLKRRQRQVKRSLTVNSTQRSSSDSGLHYLKSEVAKPTPKRRALTLQHLGRPTKNSRQVQREASPTAWPNFTREYRRGEQDHESSNLPSSREGSIPEPGFGPPMLKDEHLGQKFAALSKTTASRRSSSGTRGSASRSTSFFRKFPWYKVALVDKQPVVQALTKGDLGNHRISRSVPATQFGPTSGRTELSRGFSKSHALVECRHEEDDSAPKIQTTPNQASIDQQTRSSDYKVYSRPSLHLVISPQEMSERQIFEQRHRAQGRSQDSHAISLKTSEERLSRDPHQAARDVIGHAQAPTRAGPFGSEPRVPSQSRPIGASFESPISGDILQSLQSQWPEVKEHSRNQSYTSSNASSLRMHADSRPEQGSSGSGTVRPEQEFTGSRNPSHQLRSQVINFSPKRLSTSTDPLPARVNKNIQGEPVRRELKGKDKGIKKIQVTVTFDGAEDLMIEATLKRKDRQEHWRTMA